MNAMNRLVASSAAAVVTLSAGLVCAQGAETAEVDTQGSTEASASSEVSGEGLAAPSAEQEQAAQAKAVDAPPADSVEVAQVGASVSTDAGTGGGRTGTDHSQMVGTFAIGYMGFRQMSLGTLANVVQAPVIGGRYWLNPQLGIDVGLGFSTGSGTNEVDTGAMTTETDNPAPLTFILHAGVPLSLADAQHFSFQVVPEINFGLSSMTIEGMPDDTDLSGTHLDIGARAGGELHFGFIDVPQLSLQAGVALRFNMDSAKQEVGNASATESANSISTGVGDNPWNIFTANIAALYYFDN